METVSQLLQAKGSLVLSVSPDTSVFEALKLMAEKNVGALLVMSDGRLRGIMSERDYARKVILLGKSSHELAVSDIMSDDVVSVTPAQTVDDCMALMSSHRVRHLPVIDNGRVVGVLSIGDLVKALIEMQQQTIQQLESYIHS
ncbi:MAG: putative signal transduction protein with domain [Proteobacteria bacterium]|nr:putative signal transduction protein with domain [Pseudomonadota bacterium]